MDAIEIAERYQALLRKYEKLESDINGFLADYELEYDFIDWKEFREGEK